MVAMLINNARKKSEMQFYFRCRSQLHNNDTMNDMTVLMK